MSDTVQDIRAWARERGIRVGDSGPIPASVRSQYDDFLAETQDDSSEKENSRTEERAPKEVSSEPTHEVSAFGRVRERARKLWGADRTDRMLVRPKRASKARISVDRLIQRAWGAASDLTKNANPPVSRVLMLQSPVAGMLLEETVRDTAVDRLLQPLARGGHQLEIGHALIGPPLFTYMLTKRPEMAPLLVPLLKDSLRTWIDVAGPKIEQAARREAEHAEKYGGHIDQMLEFILEGIMPQQSPNGHQ